VAARKQPLRNISGTRSLFKCPVVAACLGESSLDGVASSPIRCAAGHHGPLCARCETGWLQSSAGALCEECPAGGVVWSEALPIVALIPVAYGARRMRDVLDASVQAKITVGTVQVVTAFASTYQIKLPDNFAAFLSGLNFLNVDVSSVFALQCAAAEGSGFYVKFWTTELLPILIAALIVGVGKGAGLRLNTMIQLCFVMIFLLYPTVSRRAFQVFDCHDLDRGESWLKADYAIDCNDLGSMQLLGLFFVVVYALGVPCVFFALLRSKAELIQADDADTKERFGFLIDDYVPSCYYWEPIDLSRKLILTSVLMFFRAGTVAQLMLAQVVSVLYCALQCLKMPYADKWNNMLKIATDLQIIITLTILLGLKATAGDSSADNLGASPSSRS
jgi:hypothetical protein